MRPAVVGGDFKASRRPVRERICCFGNREVVSRIMPTIFRGEDISCMQSQSISSFACHGIPVPFRPPAYSEGSNMGFSELLSFFRDALYPL